MFLRMTYIDFDISCKYEKLFPPYAIKYLIVEEAESCERSHTGYQQSAPVGVVSAIQNFYILYENA